MLILHYQNILKEVFLLLESREAIMKQQSMERAIESLKIESEAILDIVKYLDRTSFSKAVDALANCNKIITCASGSSGIAAKKFSHSLCCIERPSLFLSPSEAVHGGLGCVQEGDVVIFVSRGGQTAELLPILDVCVKKGVTIIALTENLQSHIAKQSDIVIKMQIAKESDKYNIMATSSYVVSIAIFDALLSAIMEETDYKLEQFALIHPGGAVGNALNNK